MHPEPAPPEPSIAEVVGTLEDILAGMRALAGPAPDEGSAAQGYLTAVDQISEWLQAREFRTALARAARDAAHLDAIERGEVEVYSMGTTVKYLTVHGPGGDYYVRAASTAMPLREAVDRALGPPSTENEGAKHG